LQQATTVLANARLAGIINTPADDRHLNLLPALVLFFMPSRPSTQPSRTAH
jgi:hypothetical protein